MHDKQRKTLSEGIAGGGMLLVFCPGELLLNSKKTWPAICFPGGGRSEIPLARFLHNSTLRKTGGPKKSGSASVFLLSAQFQQ